MADMAPMKAYQGSRGMKRVASSDDCEHCDNPSKLGKRYKREAMRLKTVVGKHMKPRVSKGGIY